MNRLVHGRGFHNAALLCILLTMGAAGASPSNKWRIEVRGGADSDGTIVISLAPVGETPVPITVEVPKGTGENRLAKRIRDAFRSQVDDRYKSEVDDGEDVLVKKRNGTPDFDLSLTSNSVEGIRVRFNKE